MIKLLLRHLALSTVLTAGIVLAAAAPASAAPAPGSLSQQDRSDLARVEEYLNTIRTLQARFLQIAPNGATSEGTVWLSRPGRLRFEYDPPVPILVVADGRWLIYHDKELEQVSYIPLGQTPAGLLVRDNFTFAEGVTVTDVKRSAGMLRISVVDANDPGAGTLTLVFSEQPLQLRQWLTTDPQGQITAVTLFEPRLNVPIDRQRFVFHDPRPLGSNPAQ